MLSGVLSAYGLEESSYSVVSFGSGLINNTWKVEHADKRYILQRINDNVFRDPAGVAKNIEMMGDYLSQKTPDYLFVEPIRTGGGESMIHIENEGYFRLFPFVHNSHTVDVVSSADQSYEAAIQFGRFTKLLSGFNVELLHTTIPDFHNLSLRYDQFLQSVQRAGKSRRKQADELFVYLDSQKDIVDIYKRIQQNPSFRLRVTHHDTKISNVLFDNNDKGLCVIDLDTVMSGYFISDIGDMLRTYLCPVTEEEKDFSRISIREDFFISIVKGYLIEMENELTAEEKKYFVYAGKFMIYMQALRFLTDYLDNDIYYGQKYEGHNLVRAGNQSVLLQRLTEKENELMQGIGYNNQPEKINNYYG